MKMSEAFPSEFLRAADLQERHVNVTISHVEPREIGGDVKPVLFFVGKSKGMVLNKTNGSTIAAVYGDDTDSWADEALILYPTMVDFQGRSTPAIRVKVPPRQKVHASAPMHQPSPPDRDFAKKVDDEIPF